MPTKIDATETDYEKGLISQGDLLNAISDFNKHVSITTVSPHETIIRTRSAWFKAHEILLLLGLTEEQVEGLDLPYDGLRMHLTVHPDQDSCSGVSYRNHVSVAILPTQHGQLDVITDGVLIPGFKSFPNNRGLSDCCGNMKPPPNSFVLEPK